MKKIEDYLIPIVVLLAVVTIFSAKSCIRYKREAKSAQNVANGIVFNLEAKTWKDKYNQEHLQVKQYELEKAVFNKYVDSTAKLLNIKSKQIQSITQINSDLNIKLKNIFSKDTSYRIAKDSSRVISQIDFKYKNPLNKDVNWLNITGTIGDVDSLDVTGKDSLQIVDYWKRLWLLGPKQFYVDVTNKNPFINPNQVKTVKPVYQEPTFILGPSLQGTYLNQKVQFYPGVSLIYYPFSIKIK